MGLVSAGPERTEPAAPAPPTPPYEPPTTPAAPASAVTTSMAAFGGKKSCPNCGARMAADQRYCLNCGHRRGEPRLPFMDAVVFMESMSAPGAGATPPPPPSAPKSSPRMNANAALIAGVATLVLAIGVGFLIGRSGHEGSSNAAAQAPIKVIEVGGGGGGETAETATPEASATTGAKKPGRSKGASKTEKEAANSPKATKKAKENSQVGEHGASKATEETLHPEGGVKLAAPEVKVGGECETGTAGCGKSGEFEGNFFGE
jgi:hypothetical protein